MEEPRYQIVYDDEDTRPGWNKIATLTIDEAGLSYPDEALTAALQWMTGRVNNPGEPLRRTKENCLKSWLALRALEMYEGKNATLHESTKPSSTRGPDTALKAAFEAAFPTKHPDHRNFLTIDFGQFFAIGVGNDHVC